MNDLQMNILANDRIAEYRSEARRQRLARSYRQADSTGREQHAPRSRRLGFRLMLGRLGA